MTSETAAIYNHPSLKKYGFYDSNFPWKVMMETKGENNQEIADKTDSKVEHIWQVCSYFTDGFEKLSQQDLAVSFSNIEVLVDTNGGLATELYFRQWGKYQNAPVLRHDIVVGPALGPSSDLPEFFNYSIRIHPVCVDYQKNLFMPEIAGNTDNGILRQNFLDEQHDVETDLLIEQCSKFAQKHEQRLLEAQETQGDNFQNIKRNETRRIEFYNKLKETITTKKRQYPIELYDVFSINTCFNENEFVENKPTWQERIETYQKNMSGIFKVCTENKTLFAAYNQHYP